MAIKVFCIDKVVRVFQFSICLDALMVAEGVAHALEAEAVDYGEAYMSLWLGFGFWMYR